MTEPHDAINEMNRDIIKDILKMMPTAYLLEALGVDTVDELWGGRKMTDLISRADAIRALAEHFSFDDGCSNIYKDIDYYKGIAEHILKNVPSALSSADAVPQSEQYKKGFEDAKRAFLVEYARESENMRKRNAQLEVMLNAQKAISADAVQGWRIGKPTEQGKYMVTLDSFGHKRIDLFYYGKPMMPNRKVRGRCWYRSDDEWGDVVYDDTDILAWMPLPKPYKGGDDE